MANRILIIKHDDAVSAGLARYYKKKSWQVEVTAGTKEAKDILLNHVFDPHVIVADLGMPDGSILDYLEELQEAVNLSEWIFVIDEHTDTDIERIDELAYDFITKPLEQRRLDVIVNRALRSALTRRRLRNYSEADYKRYQIDAFLGKNDAAKGVKNLLSRMATVPLSTMIISGETGTGKGLIARIIHNTGLRREGPMVELNCAALPKELLESQLFGHEAGSFTGAKGRHRGLFEQADGGTLFLDEIGDMDLNLQAKLLKAIEDQKIRRLGGEREIHINVQIVAASSKDLETEAMLGKFREDLYHRLSVFRIELPSLRERKDDLVELVPRIVAEYNAKANKNVDIIPDKVWEQLLTYDWPGNVRELRNVIERCVLLSKDGIFPHEWLQLSNQVDREAVKENVSLDTLSIPLDGSMRLDEMDSYIIETALKRHNYNVTETARSLGTTRETLRYRIQKYKLDIPA